MDEGLEEVTRILTLIRTQPSARRAPLPGDLEGRFDVWFDGGAVKHDTGESRYRFADGASATVTSSLRENFLVVLRDGARIGLPQRFLLEPFTGAAATPASGASFPSFAPPSPGAW
jgi:hypothetical protein